MGNSHLNLLFYSSSGGSDFPTGMWSPSTFTSPKIGLEIWRLLGHEQRGRALPRADGEVCFRGQS